MIDRRRFLQGVLGAAGAYALSGCRGREGQEAPVGRIGPGPSPLPFSELEPRSRPVLKTPGENYGLLTPFGYFLPPAYFTMMYLYDSLLWTDSTGALIPWLAAAPPASSPDGLTHTFQLRDNVRWHDGQPLTSADVVFTFDYFRANAAKIFPTILFQPQHVAAVRATGPQTVQFRLDKPAVTFLESVAGRVPIIPRHIWSAVADVNSQDRALVVGSGPYRLQDYSPTEGRYLFVANDDFFLGRPFVQRIESRQVGDPVSALLTGDIDVAGLDQPSADQVRGLRREGGLGIASGPPDFLYALYWNLKQGASADPRFRQACARAIDRNDLVRRMAAGLGEAGNPGFLPGDHPFRVEVEQYAYDPAAARTLLDKAGYRPGDDGVRVGPDGKQLRLRLATLTVARVARPVAEYLRRVGIEAEIDPTDMVNAGSGDMSILLYGGHQGDPDYLRMVYSSRVDGGFFRDAAGYSNAEFDDLADRQLVTQDVEERKRLVARMQEIVAADLPLLHLYYPAGVFVWRNSVLDQVKLHRNGLGGPLNKQALVTGVATGGTQIRPTL